MIKISLISSDFDWTIHSEMQKLTTSQIFDIESAASVFLLLELEDNRVLIEQDIFMVTVDVKNQTKNNNDSQFTLSFEISLTYGGDNISDFTSLLTKIVTNEVANNLLDNLKDAEIIKDHSASTIALLFSDSNKLGLLLNQEEISKEDSRHEYLLVVGLIVCSCLFILASVFFLRSILSRKSHSTSTLSIKRNLTDETSDSCEPSAVLGANCFEKPDPITMTTPQRNSYNNYNMAINTPMNKSPAISTITENSRSRLGILSMNTLAKWRPSDKKKELNMKSLYNITLED